MDILQGKELVNKSGNTILANHALKDKTVIAFYFSAHWCPPCRQFTPLLAKAYAASRTKGQGGNVEVIFVSSDRTESDLQSYMKESHGDWLAIPFDDPVAQTLSAKFGVRGIPALKIVGIDGSEISADGREEVMSLGPAAFAQWEKLAPACIDVSTVKLLNDNPESVRKEAVDILVKLLSNVVRDPNNIKYRQVKLSNKKIEENLLPATGAFEILFSVGFEEDDDKLILPLAVSISKVEKFLDAIQSLQS
eukprot:GFUD01003628.1.p1 GENE.GFUD01003628.1~~GFUD01003628.1.p1  ORF type:complete len:250 (+),score=53.32 GFUD01003628.1:75-824(+)